ncbi:alpha/beta fold hydrolase [Streptantibioticus ferralitis]|uniref:Alpha/beta hydrolase n=1 Tax=Streptantibioticus ferralitis TaxID=236510 RepID=A0ABT5Z854_9ACTN|nr:alpha/beta hydrolase [Streptantibioticus ferralitis]MDF2260001.1 alpha/beta hydrolase [Streptantibioticus ferralitis]
MTARELPRCAAQGTAPPGRILRVGGTALHVLREGAGPVCVLSGGLGLSWFDWDPVIPLVTPYRTVVRFDRPGYGFSAPPVAVPTAAAEADRIRRVLDALGLHGPCTVAGHAVAGFHAEAFARLYPERTAGLLLVDASAEEAPEPPTASGLRTAAARALAAALTAAAVPYVLGPTSRRLAWSATTLAGCDPASAPLVRRTYRTGRVLRATLLENARYPDMAAEIHELRTRRPLPAVPVTVLAAYDGSGSRRALHWLRRQLCLADELGARFKIVTPSGHLIMIDRPQAVASALLDPGIPLGRART